MTTAEPRRAGATLAALNSGSGLHKLVKMGSAASSYAPSDVEVAHIEAQFTGPDLHESAKELLQSSASEEVERRALLDRMQEFDMVMDRVDAHGSAKMDGGLSDVHTASTHGLSFDSAQGASIGFDVLDSAAFKSIAPVIHRGIETFGLPDGLDLVGEDDDEDPEEEDLLCDYAPGPLQTDGSVGLVADDGTVSLPVTPTLARSGWSCEMNRGPTDEPRRATRCGVVGWGGADEPCLSDSWQHLQERDADAREGASITALRAQYHRMFGKETSSNNRQWLLRRLSEIRRYGDGEEAEEEEEDDDSAGGDHSGAGDRSDLDDDGRVSPFTSGGSAGTHVTGDYLDGTLSPRKAKGAHFKGGPAPRREARGFRRGVALLARESPGRRGAASVSHGGSKGSRRGRGDPADSHSGEGGAAKTDGSVAGRKRKGGHHSDSDEGEPPVKSRAVAHAGGRGHGKAGGRKGADGAGGNGRRSKHHNPWALEEAEALVDGVAKCGGGKWADIKKLGFPAIEHRTAVDLKDKWRNLLRIAMLPHQPVKSAGDKKREIPAELLARVRELAAKQAKKAALDGRSRSAGR